MALCFRMGRAQAHLVEPREATMPTRRARVSTRASLPNKLLVRSSSRHLGFPALEQRIQLVNGTLVPKQPLLRQFETELKAPPSCCSAVEYAPRSDAPKRNARSAALRERSRSARVPALVLGF